MGKARTPYEFRVWGTMPTILREGFVARMGSMPCNPYDGRTFGEAIEQMSILADQKLRTVIVGRG
jgi:hypothetical protein